MPISVCKKITREHNKRRLRFFYEGLFGHNFLAILGFLISVQNITSQTNDVIISKVTTEDGLSHNTVFDIVQDHNGLMWFATREGLNRYDSYSLKTFYFTSNNSGLPSNFIKSLFCFNKQLFIGTDSGLAKYIENEERFEPIEDLLDMRIITMEHATKSSFYICTTKGLFTMDKAGRVKKLVNNKRVRSAVNYRGHTYYFTQENKIYSIDFNGELIKTYTTENNLPNPDPNLFLTFFIDNEDTLWLGTRNGLFYLNTAVNAFVKSNLIDDIEDAEAQFIREITQDDEGNLILGGEGGIIIVNKQGANYKRIKQAFTDTSNSLSDNAIYSLFNSEENILWMGTYFGGVNYLQKNRNGFKAILPSVTDNYSISGKAVSQIMQTKDGKLWIASEDGGISILNRNKKRIKVLDNSPDKLESISSNNIHSLFEDDDGTIWIGTFFGGLNRYDVKTKTNRIYRSDQNDPFAISNNSVLSILRDSRKRLWLGTHKGLNLFNDEKETFNNEFIPDLKDKFIYDIFEDNKGHIWFCTHSHGIYKLDSTTDEITQYAKESNKNIGLSSDIIITAYQDSQERLWFGSLNGGLIQYDSSSASFKSFTIENGLPNNNIYGIKENPAGGLWIASNKGISLFNPDDQTCKTYTIDDGLSNNQFNFNSSFKDDLGYIYFGSVRGLTYFHPDSIDNKKLQPKIFLKELRLFNESVTINSNSPLRYSLNKTDSLILNYNQNALTIDYIGVNYQNHGENSYTYYLEGFDQTWNHVDNKKSATYTNLSPGNYTFHLKANAVPDSEFQNAPIKSLAITILPPFWKTNLAYLCYFIFLLALVYLTYYIIKFVQTKNLAIKLEKVENEKIKEITKNRLNFFTFISHEFKTPITLMMAAVDQYLQKISQQNNQHEELRSIKHSAQKLNHLVKQLMLFRKIETEHEELKLVKGDIILYIKDTYSAFHPLFSTQKLQTSFNSNLQYFYCHFDAEKLETILTNLISNSIKNTEENGYISVDLHIIEPKNETANARIKITINDTGQGFNSADTEQLFDPFYSSPTNIKEKNGTGIGLSLVKSLVEFLGGTISLKALPEKGTSCKLTMPLLMENILQNDVKDIDGNKSIQLPIDFVNDFEEEEFTPDTIQNADSKNTIMIIEDNFELRSFLKKHFNKNHKVGIAKNGKEALSKLDKIKPDLIITDLKMPIMDGNEFCKRIKLSPNYSHIPVILLTGQTLDSHKLNALDAGANAFMAKPFNLKELDIMVRNLLASTKNFEQRFSGLIKQNDPKSVPSNNKEREFKLQVVNAIETNLDNPKFNVENLAKHLGISRSLLHLKMKDITKKGTSHFINEYKMDKAKILLIKGYSITEAAYKVGFNDPNYFTRCFKRFYKQTPSEFIKTERKITIENE